MGASDSTHSRCAYICSRAVPSSMNGRYVSKVCAFETTISSGISWRKRSKIPIPYRTMAQRQLWGCSLMKKNHRDSSWCCVDIRGHLFLHVRTSCISVQGVHHYSETSRGFHEHLAMTRNCVCSHPHTTHFKYTCISSPSGNCYLSYASQVCILITIVLR